MFDRKACIVTGKLQNFVDGAKEFFRFFRGDRRFWLCGAGRLVGCGLSLRLSPELGRQHHKESELAKQWPEFSSARLEIVHSVEFILLHDYQSLGSYRSRPRLP